MATAPQDKVNPANESGQLDEEDFARVPMTLPQSRLAVGGIPGYHLQWILGRPDRMAQAHAGGFRFVAPGEVNLSKVLPGDGPQDMSGTDLGSRVSVVAGGGDLDGKGQPVRLYLMKQKIQHYLEDQAIAQKGADRVADALMGQFRAGRIGGQAEGETIEDTRLRYVDGKRSTVPTLFQRKPSR